MNKFYYNISILLLVATSVTINSAKASRYKIKPSESMQAGIAKENIFAEKKNFYNDEAYDSDENDGSAFQSLDEENSLQSAFKKDEKYEGYFKIGEPYEISGTKYFPQNYENFEEVGTASWYGAEFHGKQTANGEIYNSGDMTAAHRTLPLPSVVRITNLNNNKSAVVRVNDRGPFAKNRVIDVSEKVAEVLEFKNKGTADVKVELMRENTDEMLDSLGILNKE